MQLASKSWLPQGTKAARPPGLGPFIPKPPTHFGKQTCKSFLCIKSVKLRARQGHTLAVSLSVTPCCKGLSKVETILPSEVGPMHLHPGAQCGNGGSGQVSNDGRWGVHHLAKKHARLCFLFPFHSLSLSAPQGFFWRGNKMGETKP